jgi:Domain of unknown function (DUF4383)
MTAKKIATALGAVFIVVGLIGFAAPTVMGMHLSVAHNIVHLVSGALALYFGLKGTPAGARTFCILFGAVYGLLGLVGFVAGTGSDRMFTVIPDQLMLGTMDHVVHLVLGAVFLIAGLYKKPMIAAAPRL